MIRRWYSNVAAFAPLITFGTGTPARKQYVVWNELEPVFISETGALRQETLLASFLDETTNIAGLTQATTYTDTDTFYTHGMTQFNARTFIIPTLPFPMFVHATALRQEPTLGITVDQG